MRNTIAAVHPGPPLLFKDMLPVDAADAILMLEQI
jgi:hypothetical protein